MDYQIIDMKAEAVKQIVEALAEGAKVGYNFYSPCDISYSSIRKILVLIYFHIVY
jgi:hypothetical protein